MDTVQILFTLPDVGSILDFLAIDLLPSSITNSCIVIVNADPHTKGMFPLASLHFRPESSSAQYIDSYGIVPFVPDILAFIRRNCTTWDVNRRNMQGLTSDVCGKYCCLFSLCMDRGYTQKEFITLFDTFNVTQQQLEGMFASEFGAELPRGGWRQCSHSCL